MALTQMTFDKVWTNPEHFPTYEPNEEQVREDMQYLFDKIKNCYNNHLNNEFIASNMMFAPTQGGVTSTNVQAAIEFVHQEAISAVAGDLPAGSITTDKLCQTEGSEAVTTATMQDECVTTDKLADGCVTVDKLDSSITFDVANLADNSITQEKLADGAVGTDQIENYSITGVKIGQGEIGTDQLAPGAVTFNKTSGVQKSHVIVGPVSVATSAWSSETLKANVTVTGVSLTNVATQKVDWTPADRATWSLVRDNGVCVLRIPPANNTVTLECETIPDSELSLYFCIWD